MKIVVTSEGNDLEAAVALVFDRCETYVFVDFLRCILRCTGTRAPDEAEPAHKRPSLW